MFDCYNNRMYMHGMMEYFLETSFILRNVVYKIEIYMNYTTVCTWVLCSYFILYVKDYTVLRMQGKTCTNFLKKSRNLAFILCFAFLKFGYWLQIPSFINGMYRVLFKQCEAQNAQIVRNVHLFLLFTIAPFVITNSKWDIQGQINLRMKTSQ